MDHATISSIVTIISVILVMGVNTWAVIKYLIDRMDKKMEKEREERLKSQEQLEHKIDRIKETHVLREDFHRFVDEVKGQITAMTNGLNGRMDSLFTALTTIKINSATTTNILPTKE